MANIRNLTIGNHITAQKTGRAYKNTPKLVLQGEWMKTAGFDVYTSVQVEVLNGVLTITKKGGANA
jgi:hypothetical protein